VKTPSQQKPVSVLIIDDEPQTQRLLKIALEAEGYGVTSASTGQAGMTLAAQQSRDLILLDLVLPDTSGLLVLRQLREWTQAPILVLTVLDGTAEKVEALDSGADDYVTKPFHTEELLARMRAAFRRSDKGPAAEPVFRLGRLEVDLATRRVTREGEPVKLTAKEYALLRLFVQHRGKVLTHRQILREIWGPSHEHDMSSLRVYILRLREKLETDPLASPLFQTEVGVGYRLAEP
jgi:two-component system, OmpR family, KDP operon response regulator KdpE